MSAVVSTIVGGLRHVLCEDGPAPYELRRRAPHWLGLFWVSLLTRGRPAAVVWEICLPAWLNTLDGSLGDHAAFQLLEFIESILIVLENLLDVSDINGEHVGRRILRGLFDRVRILVGKVQVKCGILNGCFAFLDLAWEVFLVPFLGQARCMQMLLVVDCMPWMYNLMASIAHWTLLAGYLVIPFYSAPNVCPNPGRSGIERNGLF